MSDQPDDQLILVLNDGETFSSLAGSKIMRLPDEMETNEIEEYLKDVRDDSTEHDGEWLVRFESLDVVGSPEEQIFSALVQLTRAYSQIADSRWWHTLQSIEENLELDEPKPS